MNNHGSKFLFTREQSSSHEGYLGNVRHVDTRYAKMVHDVFAHQVAVYDDTPHSLTPPHSSPDLVQLAHYFYKHCYFGVSLRKGDESGHVLSEQQFIQEVVLADNYPTRNHLSYLLGEVGVGKTAFVNSLISKFGRQWVEKEKLWFVRIDLEVSGANRKVTAHRLIKIISKKVLKVLQERPDLLSARDGSPSAKATLILEHLSSACGSSYESTPDSDREANYRSQVDALCKLAAALRKELQRKLILIIDNIDYICHLCDRSLYQKDGDTQEMEILEGLCYVASLFYHDSNDLGKLGANVMFVMRPDTYQVIAQAGKTSLPEPSVWDAMNAYVLTAPKWQDVLESRGKLLDYASSSIIDESKRKSFKRIIATIREDLACGPPDQPPAIEHLQKLTNYSLREMMHFFGQYAWISDSETGGDATLVRVSKQYPVALLTFMLGRRRRFSQSLSGFPNIYLINSQVQEHRHTYWLKRLILALLEVKCNAAEHFPPDRIISLFRGGNGSGYDEGIIRECLGSLSEANASNVLQVTRRMNQSNRLQVDKVALTPRGKHCISSMFDRFVYLQLVVDDHMLPIPRKLQQFFVFNNSTPDYAYAVSDKPHEFHEASATMIKHKMKLVLLFLHVLRASLEYEEELYQGVFSELRAHGVMIPNVDVITSVIIGELRRLTISAFRGHQMQLVDVDVVKAEVDKLRSVIDEYVFDIYS